MCGIPHDGRLHDVAVDGPPQRAPPPAAEQRFLVRLFVALLLHFPEDRMQADPCLTVAGDLVKMNG